MEKLRYTLSGLSFSEKLRKEYSIFVRFSASQGYTVFICLPIRIKFLSVSTEMEENTFFFFFLSFDRFFLEY